MTVEIGDVVYYRRRDGRRTRWEVIRVQGAYVTLRAYQPRARVKSGARFTVPRAWLAVANVSVQGSLL